MSQYQHTPRENASDAERKWRPPNQPQKDIATLKETVIQQQKDIDELKSMVQRLKNELRTAVNHFNSKARG
jgi:septal ring factor EnvC (AmiA/AmiB activator)